MGLPKQALRQMSSRADRALASVLLRGASIMRNPPRTEVAYVAAVVLDGIRAVAGAWEPILTRYGLSVSIQGVFCHGAPQVRFGSSRCELADLLIVVDQRSTRGLVRRAALVQAKMAWRKQMVQLIGPSSRKQLALYQHWPAFQFIDAEYSARSFRLAGSHDGEAGSFGVIDRHLITNPSTIPPIWTQHNPNPTPVKVTMEPQLGTFLTGMLSNPPGYGRHAEQLRKDDWSKLVELLLAVTYAKTFGHRSSLGDVRPPRGFTAFMVVGGFPRTLYTVTRSAEIPPIEFVEIPEEPTERALSVLHVDVTPSDSELFRFPSVPA